MPVSLIDALCSHIKVAEHNRRRLTLLDPCAGDGTFVELLGERLGADVWGVEIEDQRAAALLERLGADRAIHAPFEAVKNMGDNFDVVYCNPPYDSVGGQRVETRFLRMASTMIGGNGYVVAILPETILMGSMGERFAQDVFRMGFRNAEVWKFPEPEYDLFKQYVVLLSRGGYASGWNGLLARHGVLGTRPNEWYAPRAIWTTGEECHPSLFVDEELTGDSSSVLEGLDDWSFLEAGLGPINPQHVDFKPLRKLNPIHAAQVAAAGLLNNMRMGDAVIAGRDYKVTKAREVTDPRTNVKTSIETEELVTEFCEVNTKTGAVLVLSSEQAEFDTYTVDRAQQFVDHIDAKFPPLCTEATTAKWAPLLARIHAPAALHGHENGLLPGQVPIAASLLEGSEHYKNLVLNGEMGVGKTTVAAAWAATIAAKRRPGSQNIIILCPAKDDLIDKWAAELRKILREFAPTIHIVKYIQDVQKAFANSGLNIILLRETAAKSNFRWLPAHTTRKVRKIANRITAYDDSAEALEDAKKRMESYANALKEPARVLPRKDGKGYITLVEWGEYICPRCGFLLEDVRLNGRQTCPACHEAWWTAAPRKGTPNGLTYADWLTQVESWKTTDPLYIQSPRKTGQGADAPLARYIRDHYARQYVLIIDESHIARGSTTCLGYASADLIFGAYRSLQMTGTLYGGLASQLFPLLWRSTSWFRQTYDLRDVQKFIDTYGLWQKITTFVPSYSGDRITGYREFAGQPSERPGVSPALATLLLPQAAYLTIQDLNVPMPPYSEHKLFMPATGIQYPIEDYLRTVARQAMKNLREDKDGSLLAQYRMARRAIWDVPWLPDELEGIVWTPLNPPESGMWPKEEALLRLIWSQKQRGRKMLVAIDQINRRDPTGRLTELLELYGMQGAVLRSKVTDRMGFIKKHLKDGCDVIFTNAELLDVGVNLTMFSTIAWYGIEFDTITVSQFNRRIWRMTQTEPCEIYYLGYNNTVQAEAWTRVANKLAAMQALQGARKAGLSRLLGDDNLIDHLADALLSYESRSFESDVLMDDFPLLQLANPPIPVEIPWLWEPVAVEKKHAVQWGFGF